jgi:hypothetical protein
MKRTALISGMCLTLTALTYAPAPASAASFCADKVPGPTYYQHNFSPGGTLVATICAPAYDAGTAYLYARGSYANVKKYMSLKIKTTNADPVSASGQYYSYLYLYRPAGWHDYHAVVYDGNGNKIVDAWAIDHE